MLPLAFLVMKIQKYPIHVLKKCCEEKQKTLFLSKILIRLFMIMHYIVEENIFVIVDKLLTQNKY